MNPLKRVDYEQLVRMGLKDTANKINELAGHRKIEVKEDTKWKEECRICHKTLPNWNKETIGMIDGDKEVVVCRSCNKLIHEIYEF